MKATINHRVAIISGLSLTLLLGATSSFHAEGHPNRGPQKTAVRGNFDFSIIPANLPPYLVPSTDGDLHLRHLPLAGRFTLAGRGVDLEAKLHMDLSGEFDSTGTGVAWAPVTLTTTIGGAKTIIFEGRAWANEVNLVAVGTLSLTGRGPYEGTTLELAVEEIGPGNSDTFRLTGYLTPGPGRDCW